MTERVFVDTSLWYVYINGKTKSLYDQYWRERINKPNKNDGEGGIPDEISETVSSTLKGGDRLLEIGSRKLHFT